MTVLRNFTILVLLGGGAAFAERYEDPVRGFSIHVPDGWQPFSRDELGQMQQMLRNAGEKSEYVAGFKSAPGPIQLPYMLVQWLPNHVYGIHGQMTEAEIQEVADTLEQGLAANVAEAALRREGIRVETHQPKADFRLDMGRKQIVYSMEMDMQGMHICYLGLMQVGREGMVQPLYYVQQLDELAEGSLARRTVMSLELTPETAWTETAPAGTRDAVSPNRTKRIVRGALVGAVIGVLIGLVVWLFKKLA